MSSFFTQDNNSSFTKLQTVGNSLSAAFDQLSLQDSLGIILFDEHPHLAKSLRSLKNTNLSALKNHLAELNTGSGSDLFAGFNYALQLVPSLPQKNIPTRILILTDSSLDFISPSDENLLSLIHSVSQKNIFTTIIGLDSEYNSSLVTFLRQELGANYYLARSSIELDNLLNSHFNSLLTPLAYNLKFTLASSDFEMTSIYNAYNDPTTFPTIFHLNTLFYPIVTTSNPLPPLPILHLHPLTPSSSSPTLVTSYQDSTGTPISFSTSLPVI
jgi:hypothetical protein